MQSQFHIVWHMVPVILLLQKSANFYNSHPNFEFLMYLNIQVCFSPLRNTCIILLRYWIRSLSCYCIILLVVWIHTWYASQSRTGVWTCVCWDCAILGNCCEQLVHWVLYVCQFWQIETYMHAMSCVSIDGMTFTICYGQIWLMLLTAMPYRARRDRGG